MPESFLRSATEADLPRIAALARWVWLDSYAADGVSAGFASYLDAAFAPGVLRGPMWVIEEGEFLVAWAQVDAGAACPVAHAAPGVELSRLYVAPPRQGRGLGRRLLACIREAFAGQALWLSAWEGNHGALKFYRREGAALWGETWFELDDRRHRNEVLGWNPA
jgi:GNAT superfamily N-acetyltransferase